MAGARISSSIIPNNRKPTIFNGYRHRRIDVEPGLLQPGTFEKKEGCYSVAAVGLALQRVIPMTFTDFQLALFHDGASLCLFRIKSNGWSGGSKQPQELLWVFPEGVVFPRPPDPYRPVFRHKNTAFGSGCGEARLWEFRRSLYKV